MKSVKFLLSSVVLLFAFFAFLVCACNPEERVELSDSKINLRTNECSTDLFDLQDLFDYTGQIHNDGLAYIVDELADMNLQNDTLPIEALESHVVLYVDSITNATTEAFSLSSQHLHFLYTHSDLTSISQGLQRYLKDSFEMELSSEFIESANALLSLLDDEWEASNLSSLIESLAFAEVHSLSDCTERTIFIGMASVAAYSSMYWKNHFSDWEAVSMNEGGVEMRWMHPRDQAAKDASFADIWGMVVGGAFGAKIGATGGSFAVPGFGTVTGAAGGTLFGMISGAIGGSAVSGAQSGIKWAIGW